MSGEQPKFSKDLLLKKPPFADFLLRCGSRAAAVVLLSEEKEELALPHPRPLNEEEAFPGEVEDSPTKSGLTLEKLPSLISPSLPLS